MGTLYWAFQLVYWALSFLWLVMCVLGVVAFSRVRRASFLLQGLGAGALFLSRPVQMLLPFVIHTMGSSGGPFISVYQIIAVAISAPGILLVVGGFTMEVIYQMRNVKPAEGFPVY